MTPETIHGFWFGDIDDDGDVARRQAALWWQKSDRTDTLIRERFADWVTAAAAGRLDVWAGDARGRLALIILLDQFPRNIHRGTPRAFAHDAQALSLSLEGRHNGHERQLRPVERVFLYMPLEHAEDPDMQRQSVDAFRCLLDEVEPAQRPPFETFLDFAIQHREIIERFGRFPHRNAILGRKSTAAEAAFLRQPGSGF